MHKEFSIKRNGAWFWQCGVSYDEIQQKLQLNQITDDWLVCPFGQAHLAVPISQIDDLRQRRQKTHNSRRQDNRRKSPVPTFVIFDCVCCQTRIRINSRDASEQSQTFRCNNCNSRYSVRLAESDGFAVVVVPLSHDSSAASKPTTRPAPIIAALRALDLPADSDWAVVRTTYRRLIAKYHPDKVQHLGKELQKVAAQKTKEYNRGFEILERWFTSP